LVLRIQKGTGKEWREIGRKCEDRRKGEERERRRE